MIHRWRISDYACPLRRYRRRYTLLQVDRSWLHERVTGLAEPPEYWVGV